MRHNYLTAILLTFAMGSPAFAAGLGVGIGVGANTNIGASTNAGAAGINGQTDTRLRADSSVNANANGMTAMDRDTGHARAEDRMSAKGLAHNNAGIKTGIDAQTDADTNAAASIKSDSR